MLVNAINHASSNWALVDKALTDDWFNQTYDLNREKEELTQLLEVPLPISFFSSLVICMSRLMV